ncbi:MAG: transposase [Candidatus Handelsmanbacteria bacterium]|nr:transposase [Candidatus Handelsmanbacteria bacterium]
MARRQRSEAVPSDQEGLLEDPEFLRRALKRYLQQFLKDEISHFLLAAPYERTGERQGYRNGYKPRQLTTREGRFHSELFARYQRAEKELLLALQQSYLQGVSTRKVKVITKKLCGTHFSKSLVSSVCQQLDAEIQTWLRRPLTQPYPYLVVDARYEHVREKHRVVSRGCW